MLNFLLNKGGAGISFSREETAARLNPLMRRLVELMYTYDRLPVQGLDPETLALLEEQRKKLRTDISKFGETIYSAGGHAFTGATMTSDASPAGAAPDVKYLMDGEEDFLHAVAGEMKQNHQVRTLATLKAVRRSSRERVDFLRSLSGKTVPAS